MKKVHEMFGPCKAVRDFNCYEYIGKRVAIELEHVADDKTDQYVRVLTKILPSINISGWCGKKLGKVGDRICRSISDMYLTGHANGGRDHKKAYSYKEFFDKDQKKKVLGYRSAGFLGKISGMCPGDPDQADIIVELTGGIKIDSMCFSLVAPEEWYSEMHRDRTEFVFADGFYKDAAHAITIFTNKKHDDIFGERYFPVIVMPIKKWQEAREIADYAKSCTDPIVVGKNVVIGTRCKPDEYEYVISRTYEAGGRIPIGVEWNWGS